MDLRSFSPVSTVAGLAGSVVYDPMQGRPGYAGHYTGTDSYGAYVGSAHAGHDEALKNWNRKRPTPVRRAVH